MSLRTRLAVLFGLVGFVASGLVGAFSFQTTADELDRSTDRFLAERIEQIIEELGDGGSVAVAGEDDADREDDDRDRRPQRGNFDGGRPVAADDSIIQFTDERGRSLSSSIELPSTEITEAVLDQDRSSSRIRYEDVEIEGQRHRMATAQAPEGGIVQVARSTAEGDEVSRALLSRFLLIAAVVAGVAAAVGWFIARRTTAPLRRLTDVASEVATTGDFTTDVGDGERADEIGRLTTSFRSMLDALEASRRQQHRLIHDAGHELRTPLTSLRANAALLERAVDLPASDRAEVTAAISSELVELSSLFDEMIQLATDQHDVELVRSPVDLRELADDVAGTWRRRSGREVIVTVSSDVGPESSPIVSADTSMLERALGNLVSNAVKFSPADTPVEITVGADSLGVVDRGPGVPAAERDRIFERFYRSESTRSMPGSGLGLSIVAQIVERHGGSTWVRSSADGGTDIGFRLPVN